MTRDEARRMFEQVLRDFERGEVSYTVNQQRLEEMYDDLDRITAFQHELLDDDPIYPQPWDCRIVWPQEVYASLDDMPSIRLISPYMNATPEQFEALASHAAFFELQPSNDPELFNLSWYYPDVIAIQKST